jgi:hypothetical protein
MQDDCFQEKGRIDKCCIIMNEITPGKTSRLPDTVLPGKSTLLIFNFPYLFMVGQNG